MNQAAIATTGLTKRYDERAAVEDLALTIKTGETYGLLGPNGAGKTTTLRMLLGLVRPTSGTGTVLGLPLGSVEAMRGIGALIETPAFYPHLSGRTNLRVLATTAGIESSRIDTVLDQMALTDRAGDQFGAYSLGMKQRLGVAAALLKDPELLILDEPTNGLDPQGRADMRRLVRSLGSGQRTVVVSSHLLEDVEQICDRVGVLQSGRLISEQTVADLRGPTSLLVRAQPTDRAGSILNRLYGADRVRHEDGVFLIEVGPGSASRVAWALVMNGIKLEELRPAQRSLETAFLELTGSEPNASDEVAR